MKDYFMVSTVGSTIIIWILTLPLACVRYTRERSDDLARHGLDKSLLNANGLS